MNSKNDRLENNRKSRSNTKEKDVIIENKNIKRIINSKRQKKRVFKKK